MAYQTPELLLVGAAQNLVLFTSPLTLGLKGTNGCFERDSVEEVITYDDAALW